jgi:hypothetical protein
MGAAAGVQDEESGHKKGDKSLNKGLKSRRFLV